MAQATSSRQLPTCCAEPPLPLSPAAKPLGGNSPLAMLCTPADGSDNDTRLHRSYFDLHRLDWTKADSDLGGIEFNLPISSWLRLFRKTGFEVLDYLEVQVPPGSPDRFGTPGAWAESWPAEQVWKLRRP